MIREIPLSNILDDLHNVNLVFHDVQSPSGNLCPGLQSNATVAKTRSVGGRATAACLGCVFFAENPVGSMGLVNLPT